MGAVTLALATYGAFAFKTATTDTEKIWLPWPPSMSIPLEVQVDGLSVLVSTFVAFVSFLIIVYSVGYMQKEGERGSAGTTR